MKTDKIVWIYKYRLIEEGLSVREAEVGDFILQGFPSSEISQKLFIDLKTVKYHITNIYRKTNSKSRAKFIIKFSSFIYEKNNLPYRKKMLS